MLLTVDGPLLDRHQLLVGHLGGGLDDELSPSRHLYLLIQVKACLLKEFELTKLLFLIFKGLPEFGILSLLFAIVLRSLVISL